MSEAFIDLGDFQTQIYCNEKASTQRSIVVMHNKNIECGRVAMRRALPFENETFRSMLRHIAAMQTYHFPHNREYDPRIPLAHFFRFLCKTTKADTLHIIKHLWWSENFTKRIEDCLRLAEIQYTFVNPVEALAAYARHYVNPEEPKKFVIFDSGATKTTGISFTLDGENATINQYETIDIGGDDFTALTTNVIVNNVDKKDPNMSTVLKSIENKDKRSLRSVVDIAEIAKEAFMPNTKTSFETNNFTDVDFKGEIDYADLIMNPNYSRIHNGLSDFVEKFDKQDAIVEWIGGNGQSIIAKNVLTSDSHQFDIYQSFVKGAYYLKDCQIKLEGEAAIENIHADVEVDSIYQENSILVSPRNVYDEDLVQVTKVFKKIEGDYAAYLRNSDLENKCDDLLDYLCHTRELKVVNEKYGNNVVQKIAIDHVHHTFHEIIKDILLKINPGLKPPEVYDRSNENIWIEYAKRAKAISESEDFQKKIDEISLYFVKPTDVKLFYQNQLDQIYADRAMKSKDVSIAEKIEDPNVRNYYIRLLSNNQ